MLNSALNETRGTFFEVPFPILVIIKVGSILHIYETNCFNFCLFVISSKLAHLSIKWLIQKLQRDTFCVRWDKSIFFAPPVSEQLHLKVGPFLIINKDCLHCSYWISAIYTILSIVLTWHVREPNCKGVHELSLSKHDHPSFFLLIPARKQRRISLAAHFRS